MKTICLSILIASNLAAMLAPARFIFVFQLMEKMCRLSVPTFAAAFKAVKMLKHFVFMS